MGISGSSPHHRSIRLPGYDYSQAGAYFVTIVAQDRRCLFGSVKDGEMELNSVGKMVEKVWLEIPEHFDGVNVGIFIVMPNHIHGIIEIDNENRLSGVEARHAVPLPQNIDNFEAFGKPVCGSIPTIIRSFKSEVTKRYHEMTNTKNTRLWQRNYYEHVIRNEMDYQTIYDYILTNPLNWEKDEENQAQIAV
jgi:putative transposase